MKYTSIHEYLLINNLISYTYIEYSIGLFLFNIFIYLLLLTIIILLLFLFDLRIFKSLNELKGVGNLPFITFTFMVTLLSMAGLPPLAGFIGKFMLIIFIFFKKQFLLVIFLLNFNFFSLYFYLQNARFLIKKHTTKTPFIFFKNYSYINMPFMSWIVLSTVFNFLNVFFIEDILIVFNTFGTHLFIE